MISIKRIMRYLKGTKDYGLSYKMEGNIDLKVFIDANWVGSIDGKKAQVEEHSFLARDLCHGKTRSKIAFLNLLQRQNM